MGKSKSIVVKGTEIILLANKQEDYISLTDIARAKNSDEPRYVVQNWMKTRFTVEFLGFWELLCNPDFNRVEFDTFKNEAGSNAFVLTPQKWIKHTNAIGIVTKAGRHGGGTFAHKDIAFEFASWISAEFKLYLIKEFQRLKDEENSTKQLHWNLNRSLAKINYHIHTDSVKENLIPANMDKYSESLVYATEADILNLALYGKTAKTWRNENPEKEGNIRDYSTVEQLLILANLESMNAEMIRDELNPETRLKKLNQIAIKQMTSLLKSKYYKKLK